MNPISRSRERRQIFPSTGGPQHNAKYWEGTKVCCNVILLLYLHFSFTSKMLNNFNDALKLRNFSKAKDNLWAGLWPRKRSETGKFSVISSVQFSCSVVSNSLRPHGLQHTRPPCPSPTPGVYSNSYPLSRWCHPTISSSVVPFSSLLQSFPASGSFPMCQFFASGGNISPSNEYSGLLSFRMDWLDLLAVQGTLKNLLQHHSSKPSILRHSASFTVQLKSIHD